MRKILPILLCIFCFSTACNNKTTWLKKDTYIYSVSFPNSWKESANINKFDRETEFNLRSPNEEISTVHFHIQKINGEVVDLEKFARMSLVDLQKFSDFELVQNELHEGEKYPFQVIKATAKFKQENKDLEIRVWIIQNKAYVLTAIFNQDEEIAIKEDIAEVMDSFELKI